MTRPKIMTDQPAEKSAMKEQRDRFLAFSFASADLFFEISEEGRITHAFGAAKSLTGVDEKSLIGRKWLEIFSVYEQASMIHILEKAKPGIRIGPMLINLSETISGKKAILTGIKMPNSNKFYMSLGVSSAIMARIAYALSENQGFDILTKEVFIDAFVNALNKTRKTGHEISLSFFDFAPTRLNRTRMGEPAWKKMRESLADFLITEAFDGYTTGEIIDGRYSVIHDKKTNVDALCNKMIALTKESDPSGQGLDIKFKTIGIDIKKLGERDTERAANYVVNEFGKAGLATLNLQNLHDALKIYISENAPKMKEYQSIIERSGFSLYFQPVVDTATNEASSYEMFCHFDNGNTREWIKFGEDVGMAAQLDKAMYERAINHIKFKAGGSWTKYSVNMSIRSVEDDKFTEELMERLATHKNLSERLIFEITESTTVQNEQKFVKFMGEMHAMGFQVTLDHFSPESVFSDFLKKYTPDTVKVDGRYIRRIITAQRDSSLVRRLVETCQSENIQVIAKWVEEKEQVDALKDMGITHMQGYYFGRPGPKPEYVPQKG